MQLSCPQTCLKKLRPIEYFLNTGMISKPNLLYKKHDHLRRGKKITGQAPTAPTPTCRQTHPRRRLILMRQDWSGPSQTKLLTLGFVGLGFMVTAVALLPQLFF